MFELAKKSPVLIFDLGGVLVDLDLMRCVQNFELLGFKNIIELIGTTHQSGIFKKFESGEISGKDFCAVLRNLLSKNVSDSQIYDAWTSMLVGIKKEKLELLKHLKADAKQKIFLLSNVNEFAWDWCLNHYFNVGSNTLNMFFDDVFLSYKMKLLKPDLKIYKQLLKDANVEAKDCFFIDDSILNCDAAASIGINSYHCKDTIAAEFFDSDLHKLFS